MVSLVVVVHVLTTLGEIMRAAEVAVTVATND